MHRFIRFNADWRKRARSLHQRSSVEIRRCHVIIIPRLGKLNTPTLSTKCRSFAHIIIRYSPSYCVFRVPRAQVVGWRKPILNRQPHKKRNKNTILCSCVLALDESVFSSVSGLCLLCLIMETIFMRRFIPRFRFVITQKRRIYNESEYFVKRVHLKNS